VEAQRQIELLREALDSPDRCAAFAKIISNTSAATEAMKWAKGFVDETMRDMAVESVACAWAKCDPLKAVQWALEIRDNAPARSAALSTVFSSWVASDPKAASNYAATLGQADQTYAIASLAPALAADNPREAILWAQGFDEEDAHSLATHGVVATWAFNQPAEAAAWALTQPEGFDRADNVRVIVERWMDNDAPAAIEWASHLTPGASRDSAFDLISSRFSDANPSLAATWGESIDRSELRDARLEAIAGRWLITDPDVARSWLEKSPLPTDTKAKLANPDAPSPR